MKLLLTADLHLRPRSHVKRHSVVGDAYHALRSIQAGAVEHAVQYVVIAGDVFDKRTPDQSAIVMFGRFCAELKAKGISVVAVQGQHDLDGAVAARTCGALVADQAGVTLPHGKERYRLYCLNWSPRALLPERLAAVDECDMLVMHNAFRHLLGFEGAWDLELDMLPETARMVLVGDIHKYDLRLSPSKQPVLSPGSPYPVKSDEQGGCHAYHVMDTSDMSKESFQVPQRVVITRNGDDPHVMDALRALDAELGPSWTDWEGVENTLQPVAIIERRETGPIDPARFANLLVVDRPLPRLAKVDEGLPAQDAGLMTLEEAAGIAGHDQAPESVDLARAMLMAPDQRLAAREWLQTTGAPVADKV